MLVYYEFLSTIAESICSCDLIGSILLVRLQLLSCDFLIADNSDDCISYDWKICPLDIFILDVVI